MLLHPGAASKVCRIKPGGAGLVGLTWWLSVKSGKPQKVPIIAITG